MLVLWVGGGSPHFSATMLRLSYMGLRSLAAATTTSATLKNPSQRFHQFTKFSIPSFFPHPPVWRPYTHHVPRAEESMPTKQPMYFGGDGPGDNSGKGGSGGNDGDNNEDHSYGGQRPSSLLAWYLMLLNKNPVSTKALTSALITLIGDLFCQMVIEKSGQVDLKRTCTFTLLGLTLVGPTLHFWYLALHKWISGSGPVRAGIRLVIDQFMFAPLFIGVFFFALLTLEARPSEIIPKLRQDWSSSVIMNWKIWIPFQFLNFLVVPQQLQVLAANVIAVAWNIYLSFTTHTAVIASSNETSASDIETKI